MAIQALSSLLINLGTDGITLTAPITLRADRTHLIFARFPAAARVPRLFFLFEARLTFDAIEYRLQSVPKVYPVSEYAAIALQVPPGPWGNNVPMRIGVSPRYYGLGGSRPVANVSVVLSREDNPVGGFFGQPGLV